MRYLMIAALFLISGPLSASDVIDLQKLLSKTQSYQAKFQQLVLDAKGHRLQEVGGFMQVKRPGLFRWQTDAPFDQLLVANGDTLWVYDKDLEQVTIQPLDQRISQTPALLLSGDVKTLSDSYQVSGSAEGAVKRFDLKPVADDSLFESLSLIFDKNALVEMKLEDSLGQKTTISFVDVVVNPKLDKTVFEFQVPEGIDVIQESAEIEE